MCMIYASQDNWAATSTRCQRQHRSIKTTGGKRQRPWRLAVRSNETRIISVWPECQQLLPLAKNNSEIAKSKRIALRIKKLDRPGIASKTSLGEPSISISIRSAASGASPGSNSVNLMLVRVATRRQKQREERSWFSVTLLIVVAGHER